MANESEAPPRGALKARRAIEHYFSKWTGEYKAGPGKMSTPLFIAITSFGGFAALGIVSAITELALTDKNASKDWVVMIGSYGATLVLVFGAPAGPFSQPRNVIVGNVLASLIGVGCREWIAVPMGDYSFALPFSVALSYVVMQLTRTVNPPAGGTAAIAVISSPSIDRVGWALVIPAFLWAVIFVFIACVFINLVPGQRYPRYWFVDHQVYHDIAAMRCCQCCNCSKTPRDSLHQTSEPIPIVQKKEEHSPRQSSSPGVAGEDSSIGMGQGNDVRNQPLNESVQNRDNEGCVVGDEDGDEVLPDGHVKLFMVNAEGDEEDLEQGASDRPTTATSTTMFTEASSSKNTPEEGSGITKLALA